MTCIRLQEVEREREGKDQTEERGPIREFQICGHSWQKVISPVGNVKA